MDLETAQKILEPYIQPNHHLFSLSNDCVSWPDDRGNEVMLDGTFTDDELEAIVWWMREFADKE